jgi:hypothetical protein
MKYCYISNIYICFLGYQIHHGSLYTLWSIYFHVTTRIVPISTANLQSNLFHWANSNPYYYCCCCYWYYWYYHYYPNRLWFSRNLHLIQLNMVQFDSMLMLLRYYYFPTSTYCYRYYNVTILEAFSNKIQFNSTKFISIYRDEFPQ